MPCFRTLPTQFLMIAGGATAVIVITMITVVIAIALQNNVKNKVILGNVPTKNSVQDNDTHRRIAPLVWVVVSYLVKARRPKRRQAKDLPAQTSLNKLALNRATQIIQVFVTAAARHRAAHVVANNRIDNYGTITTINKSST
jgi:hypothetical protein